MAEDLVFSTKGGKQKSKQQAKGTRGWPSVPGGPIKIRRETKGRGGKTVTVIFDMPFTKSEAKKVMKDLQALVACGASLGEGTIELQGDAKEKAIVYFSKKGLKAIQAGA